MSKSPTIFFKYGGNAMTNTELKKNVLQYIAELHSTGFSVVVAHGGGPFIRLAMEKAGLESEFIDGHRVTSAEAFRYVESALLGEVNADLVRMLNSSGVRAIGLSGYDAGMVRAIKRPHVTEHKGARQNIDLGQVGDVESVNAELLHLMLNRRYLPVVACIAADNKGTGYNINGDMFAGHLAGAVQADQFVVLTDVDGIYRDIKNPRSIIQQIAIRDLPDLLREGVISGGMLPKVEACVIALQNGAKAAHIINGTQPEQIRALVSGFNTGTTFIN